jgi:EAL domain-containing protein (putative c-di-GMP-specific phosphodiesterase class I)/CheY-like chemotaxis protein
MHGRIRMVIADDDSAVREALADLIATDPTLELMGAAANAAEVVELARRLSPDVALLDVKMPGSGAKAAQEIRECSPDTAIIALSAHEDDKSLKDMLAGGARSYLRKGMSSQEILAAVRGSVRGGSVLSQTVAPKIVTELASRLEREREEEALRREWEERIGRVLRGEDQLTIVFQPIVELQTGESVGLEALSRFRSEPIRTPDLWFEGAALVGLGMELELAAVELALMDLERLPAEVFLSLNVSPDCITCARLAALLDPIPLERVVLEITEHAPINDYLSLRSAIKHYRSRGLRIAVDDAGAGYANLRHILQLTPDIIKLDITLTRDIDTERSERALSSALVTFAHEIGALITAEGIERVEELEVLRDLGVRYGQGYYLGKPGHLEAVTNLQLYEPDVGKA